MDELSGFAVALGLGLLIGLERERRKGEDASRAAAGLRTFALAALLGGISRSIGGDAAFLIAGGFLGVAVVLGYVFSAGEDPGLTTEVALMVTFFLGALAQDEAALAAALGVVTTVLLASRSALHRFVRELMTEQELHDLLLFSAAALVILPLLPNAPVGPYDALNPFKIWRLVVLVMGIGGAGYVGLRVLGPRLGIPLAGLAGGFVSSAATIGSMGSLARARPELARPAVAGAILSTVATFAQMAVVLAVTSPETLGRLWLPVSGGGAVALIFGFAAARRLARGESAESLAGRAFSLRGAAVFAATVTAVLFAAAAVNDVAGETGVTVAAALAGFADTHAAAASVASLVAAGELEPRAAVVPILLALTTNTLTKAIAAFVAGKIRFARPVWLGLAAVMAAVWLGAGVALLV